jgi:predicted DNA-binding transcriptional regulator YafY
MYHPTTRVLAVLELLQAHGMMRGADLAARLEVDQRSVRRYVTMLQELGIPVVSERGRHGGYRLRPGYKLPPLMFADEEALAVTLGLLAARQLGLAAAAPAVEGALAKLDRVLPAAVREQARAVQATVVLDVPPVRAALDGPLVRIFSAAAITGRRLHLHYRSWRGASERTIDPYGLVYRQGTWYAVGWCHLRADLRLFRLDHVERATPLEERFERPVDFDCRRFVQQTLATMPSTWAVEVLLETTPEEAERRVSPVLGTLEAAPGGVVLRCQTPSLSYVARYLAGLPWPLVVHQPPELVTALREVVQDLTRDIERSVGVVARRASPAEGGRAGDPAGRPGVVPRGTLPSPALSRRYTGVR